MDEGVWCCLFDLFSVVHVSEEVVESGIAEIDWDGVCFHESGVSEVFVDGAWFESLSEECVDGDVVEGCEVWVEVYGAVHPVELGGVIGDGAHIVLVWLGWLFDGLAYFCCYFVAFLLCTSYPLW